MKPLNNFDRLIIGIYTWKEIPITIVIVIGVLIFEWLIIDAELKKIIPKDVALLLIIAISLLGIYIAVELWKARKKESEE